MGKILLGIVFLALLIADPIPTMAMGRLDVGVSIPLPPVIEFSGPPVMVVIPETYVYAVSDMDEDIFFYEGWWWRSWDGRWYRSRDYSSGWSYYRNVPTFYSSIPSGWRNDYRERRWRGNQWDHQRVQYQELQQNWSTWEKTRYWEKQNSWGVQGLKSGTRSQQNRTTTKAKETKSRNNKSDIEDRRDRD
jgi:hypothetical protein